MAGKAGPWVKKEKKFQNRQLEKALHKGKSAADGDCFTIRYYDWFGLRPRAEPEDMARIFSITFKTRVKVGKVTAILKRALEKERLEDLK